MNKPRFLSVLFTIVLPVCIVSIVGCKTGRPPRKTLPDQLSGRGINEQLWERPGASYDDNLISPSLPFYAADTSIQGEKFTVIYLQNPEYDSLALSIVKSYEPFASSVLKMITDQGNKGVIIDFRTNPDVNDGEANFKVEKNNGQSLETNNSQPVKIVFLWDNYSAPRAAGFINMLQNSSLVSVKEISSKNSFSSRYQYDCFKPSSPNFDEE